MKCLLRCEPVAYCRLIRKWYVIWWTSQCDVCLCDYALMGAMCEKNGNMEVNSPTTGASSSHDSSPKPANVNVSEARKRFDELTSSIDSVLASTEYVQGLYSKLFEDQQVTGAPSASNRFSVPPRRYDDINMLQNAIEALNDWIAEAEKVKALDNKSEALDLWSFFDNLLCSFCQMRMSIHDYLAHLPSCVSPVMKVVQPRERKTFEAVLCDHVDSLSGVQCEQFRSVCREHRHINFPTRVDGTQICGYPYVFHGLLHPFSMSKACLVASNNCSRHWGWQQALRALLDSALCVTLTGLLAAQHEVILEKIQYTLSNRIRTLRRPSRNGQC